MQYTIFVNQVSVSSPVNFLFDLPKYRDEFRFNLESDIERLGPNTLAVLTSFSFNDADLFDIHNNEYLLLVTPQEDFSGVTPSVIQNAKKVIVVGENSHTIAWGEHSHLGRYPYEPTSDLSPDNQINPGLKSVSESYVFPESYTALWESALEARTAHGDVEIMSSKKQLPPKWFVSKLRSFGREVRIRTYSPNELKSVYLQADKLVRNNVNVDRIDVMTRKLKTIVKGRTGQSIADSDLVSWPEVLRSVTEQKTQLKVSTKTAPAPCLNIVCFKPTYLFADLVKRFEKAGFVHSDYPLANASAYVWLRPQEFGGFRDLSRGLETEDVPNSYQVEYETVVQNFNTNSWEEIAKRSVAIHHGTCFLPIVQFNANRLARNLSQVRHVVGVCEQEPCFGPSLEFANSNNYEFIPIGYDHQLFTKELIRTKTRTAKSTLNIGFVGRAYGNNHANISSSKYAHPKGYRKGGDHLLEILLRLKLQKIPFLLHVVGQNWDELVERCKKYELPVEYYTRDKNISYEEFPKVFSTFDALVISARAEGGPVSAIEAMSVGVPVVGTNVGILPYLSRVTKHCKLFDYDTRWHTADIEKAVEELATIYQKEYTHKDRLSIRESVKQHTTDAWISGIKNIAKSIE